MERNGSDHSVAHANHKPRTGGGPHTDGGSVTGKHGEEVRARIDSIESDVATLKESVADLEEGLDTDLGQIQQDIRKLVKMTEQAISGAGSDVEKTRSQQMTDKLGAIRETIDGSDPAVTEQATGGSNKTIGSGDVTEELDTDDQFVFKSDVHDPTALPSVPGESPPYCTGLGATYAVEALIIEWLGWLIDTAGADTAVQVIDYYADHGWYPDSVRDDLKRYLRGMVDENRLRETSGERPESMSQGDHRRSLKYLVAIENPEVIDNGI